MEGFEPPCPKGQTVFGTAALQPLRYISITPQAGLEPASRVTGRLSSKQRLHQLRDCGISVFDVIVLFPRIRRLARITAVRGTRTPSPFSRITSFQNWPGTVAASQHKVQVKGVEPSGPRFWGGYVFRFRHTCINTSGGDRTRKRPGTLTRRIFRFCYRGILSDPQTLRGAARREVLSEGFGPSLDRV